jgi:hypothetical protein
MKQHQLSMRFDVITLAVVYRNMADGRPSDTFGEFGAHPDTLRIPKCR